MVAGSEFIAVQNEKSDADIDEGHFDLVWLDI